MHNFNRIQARNYGEYAEVWLHNHYVSCDYDALGDLSQYYLDIAEKEPVNQMKTVLKNNENIFKTDEEIEFICRRMDRFYNAVLNKEIVVIANRWKIYAVAQFIGEYSRISSSTQNDNFKNRAPIKILRTFEDPVFPPNTDIKEKTEDIFEEITESKYPGKYGYIKGLLEKQDNTKLIEILQDIIEKLKTNEPIQ